MCKTCDKVEAILEEIDKNPYSFIFDRNYKGIRCHSARCPIATALSDALNGMKVTVEPLRAHVYLPVDQLFECDKQPRTDMLIFNLPEKIQNFIHKFDSNYYPHLI